MTKKLLSLVFVIIAALLLTGCSGENSDYYDSSYDSASDREYELEQEYIDLQNELDDREQQIQDREQAIEDARDSLEYGDYDDAYERLEDY